jgi:hypothetical protein
MHESAGNELFVQYDIYVVDRKDLVVDFNAIAPSRRLGRGLAHLLPHS